MSEPKETESGSDAQAEAQAEGVPPSKDDAEGTDKVEATAADADEASEAFEGEGAAAQGIVVAAPKKKKKKRDASEPETIRDRNARVRAEAADKRRSRREREQGGGTPRRNLDASEVMDDALARSTHAAAGFLTKHFNKVQWVILAGLAGWIGYEVYSWRHEKTTEKATESLFKALSAEMGKVGDGAPDMGDERGLPTDERRSFPTDDARLKAAKSEYQLAVTSSGSVLAILGEAGVAYDLGQYKEAQTAYEKVKQDPAFARDVDIKGRTLEGLGMALEALKDEDGALKAFRELQSMDSVPFSALGIYHQARIAKANGKNDDALKLIDKAGEKLASLKENPGVIRYLGRQVLELLESLDAKKATELSEKLMSAEAKKQRDEQSLGGMGGPGGKNMSADMQRRIQELMEKMKKEAPPASSGGAMPPGPVMPAPEAPTDEAPAPAPSGAP